MKQTALKWFLSQKMSLTLEDFDDIIEQALEMEKQQIIDAHGVKTKRGERQGISFWESKNGEQYYNETYKPSA